MLLLIDGCFREGCSPAGNIHMVLQVLVALFLAILFLQSGLDKISNWKTNLDWLKGHFVNTPLKNMVPAMLGTVTLLETASGTLCASGIISLLWKGCDYWIFWGCTLSAVSLLCLFFGQRIAKDYTGAQGLVAYFIVALIGIGLCAL
jgi:hypothetical protein